MLDFTGSTVVITGAASGMGAAAVDRFVAAGASVHAVDLRAPGGDRAPDVTTHRCDLGDRGQIDDLAGELPGQIDALVNAAGVPNGGRFTGAQVMDVNWLGLRHLTEVLLDRIPAGGAIVHIASTAGRGWAERLDVMDELMAAGGFAEGSRWVAAHGDLVGDGYALSKEAVQYYTQWRGAQLVQRGLRMNSICPGVTNTPILADFRRGVGDEVIDRATEIAGRIAEPAEMAPPLLFLAHPVAASYIAGVNLNVDNGTGAARASGQW